MSYLNTSMTKRADKATAFATALLGLPSALGLTAGGLAGYYGSDKPNKVPATTLGAIGGGVGTTAGALSGLYTIGSFSDDLNNAQERLKWLAKSDDYVQKLKNNPKQVLPDDHLKIMSDRIAVKKQLAKTPKWIKYLAKRPGLRDALTLGAFGLTTAAGGAAGATLGVKGGDALA